ncbi:ATP-binding cassette domain-containing protein [Escherichia coli]
MPSRNFVALVGHTGSGKSTLASLLMGYYPLTEGDIVSWSSIKFAKSQRAAPGRGNGAARSGGAGGYLPRQRDAGRDISEERVWQALETVQLAELARSMSDGIYTPLGQQGNNLSVGQKQLLALARRVGGDAANPDLDEATASIDSGTEQAIQHALAAVREHTTLVVIAHRLSTIVDADTILALHRGQAVQAGHSPATAGGPGTLLADVSTATCGRRAGSQRA